MYILKIFVLVERSCEMYSDSRWNLPSCSSQVDIPPEQDMPLDLSTRKRRPEEYASLQVVGSVFKLKSTPDSNSSQGHSYDNLSLMSKNDLNVLQYYLSPKPSPIPKNTSSDSSRVYYCHKDVLLPEMRNSAEVSNSGEVVLLPVSSNSSKVSRVCEDVLARSNEFQMPKDTLRPTKIKSSKKTRVRKNVFPPEIIVSSAEIVALAPKCSSSSTVSHAPKDVLLSESSDRLLHSPTDLLLPVSSSVIQISTKIKSSKKTRVRKNVFPPEIIVSSAEIVALAPKCSSSSTVSHAPKDVLLSESSDRLLHSPTDLLLPVSSSVIQISDSSKDSEFPSTSKSPPQKTYEEKGFQFPDPDSPSSRQCLRSEKDFSAESSTLSRHLYPIEDMLLAAHGFSSSEASGLPKDVLLSENAYSVPQSYLASEFLLVEACNSPKCLHLLENSNSIEPSFTSEGLHLIEDFKSTKQSYTQVQYFEDISPAQSPSPELSHILELSELQPELSQSAEGSHLTVELHLTQEPSLAEGSGMVEGSDLAEEPKLVEGSDMVEGSDLAEEPKLVDGSSRVEGSDLAEEPKLVEGSDMVEGSDLAEEPKLVEGSDMVEGSDLAEEPKLVEGSGMVEGSDLAEEPKLVEGSGMVEGSNLAERSSSDGSVAYGEGDDEGNCSNPVLDTCINDTVVSIAEVEPPQGTHIDVVVKDVEGNILTPVRDTCIDDTVVSMAEVEPPQGTHIDVVVKDVEGNILTPVRDTCINDTVVSIAEFEPPQGTHIDVVVKDVEGNILTPVRNTCINDTVVSMAEVEPGDFQQSTHIDVVVKDVEGNILTPVRDTCSQ